MVYESGPAGLLADYRLSADKHEGILTYFFIKVNEKVFFFGFAHLQAKRPLRIL